MVSHPIRTGGLVALGLVVVMVAGLWLGASSDRLPSPAPAGSPSAAPTRTQAASSEAVTPRPGDSGHVTSSRGVDWGADLPRLGGSPFAQTRDPGVFAASVQAAGGYDYSSFQPTDAGEERQRITEEWLAGMTGTDGPLGEETHRAMQDAVGESINPDELSYRIASREVDSIDILAVQPTDNAALRADAGNDVYLAVIGNRDTLHALSVVASVTTEVQAVRDISGFKQTQTRRLDMIVRCDPAVNDGTCELVGVIGGGSQ